MHYKYVLANFTTYRLLLCNHYQKTSSILHHSGSFIKKSDQLEAVLKSHLLYLSIQTSEHDWHLTFQCQPFVLPKKHSFDSISSFVFILFFCKRFCCNTIYVLTFSQFYPIRPVYEGPKSIIPPNGLFSFIWQG